MVGVSRMELTADTNVLWTALSSVATWQVFLVVLASAAYGIAVGSIPGLTATMAVALIVPLTFYLTDIQAIAAIVTTVTCSIFAGDLPAALVRIPGTPASAAYADDAYSLSRQGRYFDAMGTSLLFSVIGGVVGTLVLAFAARNLARLARDFTSYEYFWLYVLGLSCAVVVSNESRFRGAFALALGLLLSTVGLGTDFSQPRLTFGLDQLITGINFIPAMIGLFGMSEVLRNVLGLKGDESVVERQFASSGRRSLLTFVLPLAWRRKWHLLRSSAIGSLIGMLPGAGADIASWISYAVSKRFSREPGQYGRGSIEGLGDATGANNAALGGAWIPALVFGIPGDSVTAIALGVLMMKNITPGPDIFDAAKNPAQASLVVSIYVIFFLSNLILIPMGLTAIRASSYLVQLPRRILLPMIVLFCIVGSYAMSGSYFDVWVMLGMGLLGFVLERFCIPLGPVVLGLIMGGQLEHNFLQSITKSTDLTTFVSRPIAAVLAILCALLWFIPLFMGRSMANDSAKSTRSEG